MQWHEYPKAHILNSRPCSRDPLIPTHRPQSSSFVGLPYRILNMNPKKELLWGLWVDMFQVWGVCHFRVLFGLGLPEQSGL